MSIASKMQIMTLQEKKKVKKPSGASVETWEDVEQISISVSKKNDMLMTNSLQYNESSHVGITFKPIKEHINRLIDSKGNIYSITSVTPGRRYIALLKVVDANV